MATFRFIHAADLHLDAPFQSTEFFDRHWINRLKQSTWSAFDNLLELAIDNKVDFLVISGDIFDKESYSINSKDKFYKNIRRLSNHQIHTYIILGNHDLAIDAQEIRTILEDDPYIHLFSNEKVEMLTHNKHGKEIAKIYGRGFWEAPPTENPALQYIETASRDHDEILKIAVAHGRVGEVDECLPCASYSLRDLKTSSIHYWAMGHIHKRKVYIDDVPLVVNPGRIQGTSFDELDSRGCYIVEWTEKQLVNIEFHSLEMVRWEKIKFNFNEYKINTGTTLDEVLEIIQLQLKNRFNETGKPIIGQLVLEGKTAMYSKLREVKLIENIRQKLCNENVFVFEILDQTVPYFNKENLNSADLILEQFISVIDATKCDDQLLSELESHLKILYNDRKFQQITGRTPNQRGRGQWKIKKVKQDWLFWLEQAKKLGIDKLLLIAKSKNTNAIILEIVNGLSTEQKRYYEKKSDKTIINQIMSNYEELQKITYVTRQTNDDGRIDDLKVKISQVDGELFNSVKQWTLYTMAKWAFERVEIDKRNGVVINGHCTH